MEPVVGFGLLLLVLLAIVTFMSIRDRKNKERIDTEIRRVGGEGSVANNRADFLTGRIKRNGRF